VTHLPPPKKGETFDLKKMKEALRLHFDLLLDEMPPVIMERKCEVLDVNLGLNNQDTIKNMKKRGALARFLDLQTDKLNLMHEYGTYSEEMVAREDAKMRALKVKFLKMCEIVKFRKRRLEAKTAFVTFDSEEAYERVKKAYIDTSYGWCASPNNLLFRGVGGKDKFMLTMTMVQRPSDYIWENLSTPYPVRMIKIVASTFLAFIFLLVGFAVIIQAKNAETKAKLKIGSTDCTVYTFEYSGEPEWNSRLLNDTSVISTRVDVQHNEFPLKYNVTYPDAGLLGCYCQHINTFAPEDIFDLEFLNPYTLEMEYWCGAWLENYERVSALATAAVMVVIAVNSGLKSFFATLVEFEAPETRTQEILSITLKLFGAVLINTAFLIVLLAGNLDVFTGGKQGYVTRGLSMAALFQGHIGDFKPEWYHEVRTAIAATMFINVYALNSASFQAFVKIKLARCLDRGCTRDMSRTGKKVQVQLETL